MSEPSLVDAANNQTTITISVGLVLSTLMTLGAWIGKRALGALDATLKALRNDINGIGGKINRMESERSYEKGYRDAKESHYVNREEFSILKARMDIRERDN